MRSINVKCQTDLLQTRRRLDIFSHFDLVEGLLECDNSGSGVHHVHDDVDPRTKRSHAVVGSDYLEFGLGEAAVQLNITCEYVLNRTRSLPVTLAKALRCRGG